MTSDGAGDASKDIGSRVIDSAEDARDAGLQAAAEAAEKARGVAGRVVAASESGRVKETISDLGNRVSGSGSDTFAAGRRAYSRGSDRIKRELDRQPMEALLLAGAIGYLVGWAANRK